MSSPLVPHPFQSSVSEQSIQSAHRQETGLIGQEQRQPFQGQSPSTWHSEANLLEAQRIAQVGIWQFDLDTRKVQWSTEMFRIFGLDPQGSPPTFEELTTLVHPDDRLYQQTIIAQGIESQQPYEFECRIVRPDGSVRHTYARGCPIFNESGELIRLFGTSQDITDLRRAEAALLQQSHRERALNSVLQAIHNSLDLATIFTTAVTEIAHLLQVDHVNIRQYLPELELWQQKAAYSQSTFPSASELINIADDENPVAKAIKQLHLVQIEDIGQLENPQNHKIAQLYPGAWLVVPLELNANVWGSLTLIRTNPQGGWQDSDVDLASTVAQQLTIAIQRSELYSQVQRLNADLERQVRVRTVQLEQAYEAEALLKRITDRVRDSLDEDQILQTVVQELALGLGVNGCNAALFDLEQGTSTICYEYTTILSPSQGRVSRIADFPEIYGPLLQGHHFQFCSLLPHPTRGRVATLTCPIRDDQGVMGDLWLIDQSYHAFNEQDIRLVQQVANQCAIALRQARLYRAAQQQVQELERLNRLKDDFLSTVSHELRTPVCNMKLASQMLKAVLTHTSQDINLTKAGQYLQILQDECQREISLINDLLDLSRLEAAADPLKLSKIYLSKWLPSITYPYQERANSQQQKLEVHIAPNLPTLTTDSDYLERIVTELLTNACKYTPAEETITLQVQFLPSPSSAMNQRDVLAPYESLFVNCPVILLEVTNTGTHIPIDEFDRIFEKFYRIPNNDPWKYGGTGLGLALVKRLADRLQAKIWVTSVSGQTTFKLAFPVSEQQLDYPAPFPVAQHKQGIVLKR
ncbi:MAG: GAF domain-containing protein [Leptolyngbyaceae cyanobacterium bins.59]|nr:GAF domain-containing protein [Leptolyngbyaceae cyanobacterium bins.59]